MTVHVPVLMDEVMEFLRPCAGDNFIDCTFGGGGHSFKILERVMPGGSLLGIDANKDALKRVEKKQGLELVHGNFADLKEISKQYIKNKNIKGVLIDLGLSSDELEKSGRGFSFMRAEKLDMRFDDSKGMSAVDILNSYSKTQLYDVFKHYGDVSFAGILSEKIVRLRKKQKFETTIQLVDLILQIRPRRGRIHPATTVFQALRIEVNNELEVLKKVLPVAIDLLQSGGRLAVISFHSLEDRIVKNVFRELSRKEVPLVKLLTKKPVVANYEQVRTNPRARSAKLRVVEKI